MLGGDKAQLGSKKIEPGLVYLLGIYAKIRVDYRP